MLKKLILYFLITKLAKVFIFDSENILLGILLTQIILIEDCTVLLKSHVSEMIISR